MIIRQIRTRLFLASSALLVLVAVVAVGLRDQVIGFPIVELTVAAIGTAIGSAAILSWVVGQMVRGDLRELVTAARQRPRARVAAGGPGDVDEWVRDIAADAEKHLSAFDRERALRAAVLESMTDGVIALDQATRILVMNEGARRLLGLSSTPIGEMLIYVSRAPALLDLVGDPAAATAEVQLRPDLRVVARITATPDVGPRVLTLEDVTTMRRLETIRRDFVANVSHELRTPVTVIRANAETLLGGAAEHPEIATKLVDAIHRNAERLGQMIADLLDLSRLDAGQVHLERVEVPVFAAAEAARASVEPAAAEREVTVHIAVEAGAAARADAQALDHVMVNLVENAVRHGNKGGNVWIRTRAGEPGRIRIEVVDDGPGIAPNHRERIFERFYRVDAGRSREAGGTGLGLAIVKHLVESMGGSVGVEPNDPHGARFTIDLPAA